MKNILNKQVVTGVIIGVVLVGVFSLNQKKEVEQGVIPFGTDPQLVGGDAVPTSGEENVTITASGSEPFWSFEYTNGGLDWVTPSVEGNGEIKHTTYDVGFAGNKQKIQLRGLGDSNIYVVVNKKVCIGDMSGIEYLYTVQITVNDREYNGCADVKKNY